MTGYRWLIDQFLQLPRWERLGNIVMTAIILLTVLAVCVWPVKQMSAEEIKELDLTQARLEKKQEMAKVEDRQYKKHFSSYSAVNDTFQLADINKASVDDLVKCGLSKYVANNIVKYTQRGGRIETFEDVRRLYGMTPEMLERLLKHVKLDSVKTTGTKKYDERKIELVNLNTADSVQLVKVDGIGGRTAQRILNFRSQIGLFHSIDQLDEIKGIYPESLEKMKKQLVIENFEPFIRINTVSENELFKHVYFRQDKLSKVLVAYRNQHGKFRNAEDLKKCKLVTDEVLAKILPYIVFD